MIQNKVKTMFIMQDTLNQVIHPEWQTQEMDGELWNFQTAILVELGELIDHYGYKWWKHHTPNVEQCELEIIDIVHFLLSDIMQKNYLVDRHILASIFCSDISYTDGFKTPAKIRKAIKECMQEASDDKFSVSDLSRLMNLFNMSLDAVCDKYILKNTLNIFRAKNGYKEGTYIKTWNGREDNEVLMEIYLGLDTRLPDFAQSLYLKLEEEYKKYN